MNSTRAYLRYTWFVLIMVFIVILAGGVVRMTQSGMGCPDWPTCFGRWIPPISEKDLPPDYEKYLSLQDIDHSFNVYHTWIEYFNRMLGALLGIFIFIHTIWSYRKFWRNKRNIFYISLLLLVATAFQGWLGKKVVDANLDVLKVTTHMIVALVIAALPVLIIAQLKPPRVIAGNTLKYLAITALVVVLIQIILGTQVREEIDSISAALQYTSRDLWIGKLGPEFLIHRSFSWIVAITCLLLCWKSYRIPSLRNYSVFTILLVACSAITGLVMVFSGIPALAQPIHLLLACILAICLFSFRLQMK